MPLAYRVDQIEDRGLAVLRIQGELDFDSRPQFQQALAELRDAEETRLAIDFSRVQRMSSVFIGTLIDFASSITADNKQLICMMRPKMANVCRDAGLGSVAQVVETKE